MRVIAAVMAVMIVALATISAIPLEAHSFSLFFDSTKPFSVMGTIVKVDWVNPNTFIHVRAEDKATGRVQVWAFEAPPPNPMKGAFNLTSDMFKEGETITVVGWQGKMGADLAGAIADPELAARVRAEKFACAAQYEFPDGRKFPVVGQVPPL